MADASHLENRYDVVTPPQIRLRWNLVCWSRTTCWWQWTGQNRNGKYNIMSIWRQFGFG